MTKGEFLLGNRKYCYPLTITDFAPSRRSRAARAKSEGGLRQVARIRYDQRSRSHQDSSVAQWQSIRLLTGGLLVRVQPEEPISSGPFWSDRWQFIPSGGVTLSVQTDSRSALADTSHHRNSPNRSA
jgi:hypothetical protein